MHNKSVKKQRLRAGAYFLHQQREIVGSCRVHGYKSLAVALLAASEQADATRQPCIVRQFLSYSARGRVWAEKYKVVDSR